MEYLKEHFWNEETKRIDGFALWTALQPHITKGELVVNTGKEDREGLVLVTYSKTYQYEHNKIDWDPLVKQCRGIIFDATDNYKIVALPFPKFFNYGEGGIHYPSQGAKLEGVYEKVDGSLGICFYWKGKWHITTRGSLNSDIGAVAQKMFDEKFQFRTLEEDQKYTYLFEIIFPENRICVDYGDARKLVYLGCRKITNAQCLYGASWMLLSNCLFTIPQSFEAAIFYDIHDLEDLKAFINSRKGDEFEGTVGHWSDGTVSKFKSDDYMRLHRILSQFTFKRVLESMQDGTSHGVRLSLPEELLEEFDKYFFTVTEKTDKIAEHVQRVVHNAPKESRKEFALYLQSYYKGGDVIKFAFRFMDLNYDLEALSDIILKSFKHTDFAVDDKQTTE